MEKDKNTTEQSSNQDLLSLVKSMGEQMATMQAQLASQKTKEEQDSNLVVDSDERKHPQGVEIRTYKGKPIIDMRLIEKTGIDANGQTIINGIEAICKVFGTDKEIKISYGDLRNPDDYFQQPLVNYPFVDSLTEDPLERSGASKLVRKQLVSSNGTVPENQLSDNRLVPTGRVIPVNTWKDIRYYTIMVGNEKVELAEDKIYK